MLALRLSLHHVAQLVVDIPLRSALTLCGRMCTNAAAVDSAVVTIARLDKEYKCAPLLFGDRCHLVVGIERAATGVTRP